MRAHLLIIATFLLLVACNSERTRGAVPDASFVATDAGDNQDGGNNTTDMNLDLGPDLSSDMHIDVMSDMGSDMGSDASACMALQPVDAPCCTALGADACNFGLFCAALDGAPICYALHSRMPGETCTDDIHCESGFECSVRGVCEAPCGVTPGVYVQSIEALSENTCELAPSGERFNVRCEENVIVWCRESDGVCLEQANNAGDLSTNGVVCFDPVPIPGSVLSTRSFELTYTSACGDCFLDAHLRYDRE